MKILMAHGTWYQTGGDWSYLQSLQSLYSERGDEILPFSMEDVRNAPTEFSKYFVSNINYKDAHEKSSLIDVKNVVMRAIYSTEAVNKLSWLLDENLIDVAQLNSIHNIQTLSIIPLLKERGIPVVWRVLDYKIICPNRTFLSDGRVCTKCLAGNYFWSTVKMCKKKSLTASLVSTLDAYFNKYKKYYDLVDVFLLQSDFSREIFLKAGFPNHKLKVIANPYSATHGLTLPEKDESREEYILYFGRLSSEKGVHTLIDAMKYLGNETLFVIGDGPEEKSLKDKAASMPSAKIKFLGSVWGDELNNIIKYAKLTVVPSEWYEVSPYVILQSFDFGIPVVGANIGGIPDLIVEGHTGKLFESGNSLDLARSVTYVINDNETDYFENCRGYLGDFHSPKIYYDATMSLFRELM